MVSISLILHESIYLKNHSLDRKRIRYIAFVLRTNYNFSQLLVWFICCENVCLKWSECKLCVNNKIVIGFFSVVNQKQKEESEKYLCEDLNRLLILIQ